MAEDTKQKKAEDGIIDPVEIPTPRVDQYIQEARDTFEFLVKGFKSESLRLSRDLKEMKAGNPYIPRNMDSGDADIVRELNTRTRTRKWYFRGEAAKYREIMRVERLSKQYAEALEMINGEDKNEALLTLLKYFGPPLNIRANNSIGFLTGAIVVNAFNEHDVVVLYENIPLVVYVESTVGLYPGQELTPCAVFVAGTATVPSRIGTSSMTVIQEVPEGLIRNAVLGIEEGLASNSGSGFRDDAGERMAGSTPKSSGGSKVHDPEDLFNEDSTSAPPTQQEKEDGMRTWYDSSGEHSIVAVLISKNDKEVTLRRKDGKVIKVPLTNLSEADLKYIRN